MSDVLEISARPPAEQAPYRLAGRVALVTGGTRGIGLSTSLALAGAGATVVAAYRSGADAARRLEGERLEGPGSVTTRAADLGDPSASPALVEEVVASHGRLDVLVNNAGLTADSTAVRMSDADWDLVIGVNLSAPFRLARAALAYMIEAGGGRLVNISSVIGERGNIGQANYAAAKAGLVGLTKTLAREAAFALGRREAPAEPRGLTVNAVAPGFIATDMLASVPDKVLDRIVAEIPAGRLGMPEEIARVVQFLVDDASSYVTGQTWHVNGGMTM